MTEVEFKKQVTRLIEVFPQHFSSPTKMQLIFERVKDFEESWFRKLVERIILANDPRFDFDGAARGERLARKSVADTEAMLKLSDSLSQHVSENGLEDALKQFGAKSLTEAIFKR